jgi:hypothetical protein
MSKINEIQSKLLEIEAGQFQKLCEAYLFEKGYQVISYGSILGSNKTRKGKPDLYIIQDDKFIYIECSTDKTLRYKKLKKDLEDCFNFKKTKIDPNKIVEVKLCYNFILAPFEADNLLDLCAKYKCKIELIDITVLSDALCYSFPHLANKFLGIALDTNQILKPEQFKDEYSKNEYIINFENEFMFREKELENCLEELKQNNLLIVKGEAGSGKTRFALQLQGIFLKNNPDFDSYVIMNKGINIYEDSKSYFKIGKKYLVLIDDANKEMQNLGVMLTYLFNNEINMKIIITVRDYAYEQVSKKIKQICDCKEINIYNFNSVEIDKILNSFNLIWEAKVKIFRLTKGNPRLALMCARYVKKTNNLFSLNNVTELFDSYFGIILDDLNITGDIQIKVLSIISFLRVIRKSDDLIFNKIEQIYKIDKMTFWDAVIDLNKKEILDMYESEYAKFSDQVFQNFIFYKVFFESEILDYGLLLQNFSNEFMLNGLITDSLNPILNNYGIDKIISKLKKHFDYWIKTNSSNYEIILRILKLFWFVNEVFTLGLLEKYVENLSDGNIEELFKDLSLSESEERKRTHITDGYFDILEQFHQSRDLFGKSLELIFEYLFKKPELFWRILKYFKTELMYNMNSYAEMYHFQNILYDFLYNKLKINKYKIIISNIIYKISNSFLETQVRSGFSTDNKSITFVTINIRFTEEIKKLREKIFKCVFYEFTDNQDSIIDLLYNYTYAKEDEPIKNIYEYDTKYIVPFIEKELNPNLFKDCKVVNTYANFLEKRIKINKYNYLKKVFTNSTYKMYLLLIGDRDKLFELKTEKYYNYLKDKYRKKFGSYSLEDYKSLFEQFEEIINNCTKNSEYHLLNAIQVVLLNVIEKSHIDFLEIVKVVIKRGNKIKIIPNLLLYEIYKEGRAFTSKFYKIINEGIYENKNYWKINFFQSLPKKYINGFYLSEFYKLLKDKNLNHICLTDYCFLFFYKKYDSNIFINTLTLILNRAKSKTFKANFVYLLYHIEDNEEILTHFKNDIQILKKIYLYQISSDPMDYNKKVFAFILKQDPDFLLEFLKFRITGKDFISARDEYGDFGFIWHMENCIELVNQGLDYCQKKIKYDFIYSYKNLFFKKVPFEGKVELFIKDYIKSNYKNLKKLNYIFQILTNNYPEKRIEIIKYLFCEVDSNFEHFTKLKLDAESYSISGSSIPTYEKFKQFWQDVKSLLTNLKKYDLLLYTEAKICSWENSIKNEIKNDFIDSY